MTAAKTYEEDNRKTIEIINYINKFLLDLGEYFIIPYINCHTISIQTSGTQLNSNLLLLPKGCGKTTFLKALVRGNKKITNLLPEKMFESELIQKSKESYNYKICIHYDLIFGMFGLNTKQRQQVLSFWTGLLSDGRYCRDKSQHLNEIKTLGVFGMAKDSFMKHKEDLFEQTFLDRMVMINRDITKQEKKKILNFRRTNNDTTKFKLPIKRVKPINISLNMNKFGDSIDEMALELDDYNIISFNRAQDYISLFLKANCFINGRKSVNENDLELYKKIHHYHFEKTDLSKISYLIKMIKDNPNLNHTQLIERLGWSKKTFYKYYKIYNQQQVFTCTPKITL